MALNIPNLSPEPHGIINALARMDELQKLDAQAEFSRQNEMAQAASRMAYANLLGPQFVAKMLGNPNIFPNFNNANEAISNVTNAGLSPNPVGQQMNAPANQIGNPQPSRFAGSPVGQLFSWLGLGGSSGQSPPQGQSPQGNMVTSPPRPRVQSSVPVNNNPPSQGQPPVLPDSSNGLGEGQVPPPAAKPTAQKKVITYESEKEQEKESGKRRAEAIADLDQQYEGAVKSEIPIQNLVRLFNDPVFTNMRNKVPLFQDTQLKALAKIGTPEEQDRIGTFLTSIKQQAASVVQGFKGRAMDKEFRFADQMKVNENDTVGVAMGKIKAIEQYNQLTKRLAELASEFIQNNHMNRGQALRAAAKLINADKVREDIEFMFRPPVTEAEIEHNMKTHGKKRKEVVDYLKKNGYKLEIELMPEYRNRK